MLTKTFSMLLMQYSFALYHTAVHNRGNNIDILIIPYNQLFFIQKKSSVQQTVIQFIFHMSSHSSVPCFLTGTSWGMGKHIHAHTCIQIHRTFLFVICAKHSVEILLWKHPSLLTRATFEFKIMWGMKEKTHSIYLLWTFHKDKIQVQRGTQIKCRN